MFDPYNNYPPNVNLQDIGVEPREKEEDYEELDSDAEYELISQE